MNRAKPRRYDLPSSRVLIRSLRYLTRRAQSLLFERPGESRESLEDQVLLMVRDLFLVRLLEDRGVLGDYHLSGGKRSLRLEQGEAVSRLSEVNEWAGWSVFAVGAWQELGPGEELADLYRDLHLSRFWPVAMPVEILGALWEERLSSVRRTGVYYTPRRIVSLVLDPIMERLFSGRKPSKPPRLLDPACGAGYFLLEAFRRLSEQELNLHLARGDLFAPVLKLEGGRSALDPSRGMELVKDHIFGVDIDGDALELARRGLWVEVLGRVPAFTRPAPKPGPLFENLLEGDSLLEESLPLQVDMFNPQDPPPLKPLSFWDPERGFGGIMAEGGFDAVVGNPPWVSLKGKHKQVPYAGEVVRRLIERYNADSYRPNLFEFFIRRAIELMGEGGLHSFVVPDRIAENEQFDPLRRLILEKGELFRLHFREPFPGVAADTLIYHFQKRLRPRKSARMVISDRDGRTQEAQQAYWIKTETSFPAEALPVSVEQVLKKIEAVGKRRLSDFLETGVGFIAKARRITREQESENQARVIKGEHINPYRREGGAWIEFTLANLAGGTRNLDKLTQKNRVLLRKTGARLIAAQDDSGDLPEQSLYFAFPRDRRLARPYDLAYFLGILNSRIMSFYFRHRKITNRATTPQIKKVHLDSLPIRPINFNDPAQKALHQELVQAVRGRESVREDQEAGRLDDRIEDLVAQIYQLDSSDMNLVRKEMSKGW